MKNKQLEIWAIFNRPLDYPNGLIARKFLNDRPTNEYIIGQNLNELRKLFRKKGLVAISKSSDDPISLIESWI